MRRNSGKIWEMPKHKLINMLQSMRKNCNLIWVWNQAWSGWILTGWSLFHLALFGSVCPRPLSSLLQMPAKVSLDICSWQLNCAHQSNCISLAAYVTSRDSSSQCRLLPAHLSTHLLPRIHARIQIQLVHACYTSLLQTYFWLLFFVHTNVIGI